MSTKIYNGFIFKDITSLEDVVEFAQRIEKPFKEMAYKHWVSLALHHATTQFDKETINPMTNRIDSYISDALEWIYEREKESEKTNYSELSNIDMEFSFYPVKIKNKKRIVGILFAQESNMRKEFFKLPEIEEFCYYNNTDKPDNITNANWKIRQKIWDTIFIDYKTVGETMPTMSIVKGRFQSYLTRDKLIQYYEELKPSFKDRLDTSATNLVLNAIEAKEPGILMKKYGTITYSDEFKNSVEKTKEDLKNKLKEIVTIEDLIKEP